MQSISHSRVGSQEPFIPYTTFSSDVTLPPLFFVPSTSMAAALLSFKSSGNACKPPIPCVFSTLSWLNSLSLTPSLPDCTQVAPSRYVRPCTRHGANPEHFERKRLTGLGTEKKFSLSPPHLLPSNGYLSEEPGPCPAISPLTHRVSYHPPYAPGSGAKGPKKLERGGEGWGAETSGEAAPSFNGESI